MNPLDYIIEATIPGGAAIAALVAERVRDAVKANTAAGPDAVFAAIRQAIQDIAPVYTATLSDALLASWLGAAQLTAEPAFAGITPQGLPFEPPPRAIPLPSLNRFIAPPQPIIKMPMIDTAARWLGSHVPTIRSTYDTLNRQAQEGAFTVARLATDTAVAKVRDALVESLERGGTLRDFRRNIADVLEETPLSEHHIENIYRTNLGRAYSAGQQAVISHPLVSDEFPYILYSATHDARTRPQHLQMEKLGIGGTSIYRSDDPVIRKFWAPWSWNCRCICIAISLADAANRYHVPEAIRWLETGTPPANPAYVEHPPFDLPKGWVPVAARGLTVAV